MTGLLEVPEDGRILVVRLSALGDIVFALPALRALREARPAAHLAWLVEDRHAALLEHHPAIDELMVFPRREFRGGRGLPSMLRHLRSLRRAPRWDLTLDLQSNLKSVLQLRWTRAACRAGFDRPVAREGAWRFHRLRCAPPPRAHRSARDLALVAATGLVEGSDAVVRRWTQTPDRWALPAPVVEAVDAVDAPDVLLHVTTTAYGRDKEWPAERWAALARLLRARGRRPAALWTPADRPKVDAVVDAADGALELASATPSLAHLMALCDRAALLVGTDSGPVHLAAHRGTSVVALFGATDPQVYAPPGPAVRVVYPGNDGEAPPKRDRTRRSPWMERIAVENVAAAADEALSAAEA